MLPSLPLLFATVLLVNPWTACVAAQGTGLLGSLAPIGGGAAKSLLSPQPAVPARGAEKQPAGAAQGPSQMRTSPLAPLAPIGRPATPPLPTAFPEHPRRDRAAQNQPFPVAVPVAPKAPVPIPRILPLPQLTELAGNAKELLFPTRPQANDGSKLFDTNMGLHGVQLTAAAFLDPSLETLLNATRALIQLACRHTRYNVTEAVSGVDTNPVGGHFVFSMDRFFLSTNRVPFVSHPDRLVQTMNTTMANDLLARINQAGFFTRTLHAPSDGAIVEIVTREETARLLKAGVTMEEMEAIAKTNYIAYTQAKIRCLSKFLWKPSANATDTLPPAHENVEGAELAVFLRMDANEWRLMRSDIAKLLGTKLAAMTPQQQAQVNGTNMDNIFVAANFRPFLLLGATQPAGKEDADPSANTEWTHHLRLADADSWCFGDISLVDPQQLVALDVSTGRANLTAAAPVRDGDFSDTPSTFQAENGADAASIAESQLESADSGF